MSEEPLPESQAEAPPPQRADGVVFVLQLAIILILFAAGYWFFVARRSAAPIAPTLEPLPTFGLEPALATKVAAVEQGTPVQTRYMCGLAASATAGLTEEALCQECLLEPIDRIRALVKTYVPSNLVATELSGGGFVRKEVKQPLTQLFKAARAAGHDPVVTSAYRSYEEQTRAFNTWVAVEFRQTFNQELAKARASTYSAQPGHSEHQLGTAIDVNCATCKPFDTSDSKNLALWAFLAANAHQYGFVISYPKGIEALTGYQYEPWHIRYVGIDHAVALFVTGYLDGSGSCLNGYLRSLPKG